jgi:hypothetical protein
MKDRALAALTVQLALALWAGNSPAENTDWTTDFERSGGLETPRYAETIQYCQRLAEASPWLRFTDFGESPQGRPLPLLIADRDGHFTPQAAHGAGKLIVLIQACIHAGEVCGKDAGLMLVRDMTVERRPPELPGDITLLLIPIFNVDGHERFGPFNRINQNGPKQMGWRTTAQNLNLNRDYLKADAPEMQAWLRLWQSWLPDFFVDIHSTDGADYQYPITYAVEIFGNLDSGLTGWLRDRYVPHMESVMADGGFPLSPYVVFRNWYDPRSGLMSWVARPRLSQGYVALQNRPGLLIEAHMLKDYATRVWATYAMLQHTLVFLSADHPQLWRQVRAADEQAAGSLTGQPLALRFEATSDSIILDFLGYAYQEINSKLTGGTWFRYSDRPETFQVAYYNVQRPVVQVMLPEAYIVPAEWAAVIERLDLHGVMVQRLPRPWSGEVRTYRFANPSWQEQPYEGRHPVNFEVEAIKQEREFPAGSAVVDMRQRAARVAAHILEPEGPDSFARWGFFDAVFQRSEYVEPYVIEKMARQMLDADPELRREFARKKARDEQFAGDPRAIRDWFYQRTPYYDARLNIYPVGLVDDRAVVDSLLVAAP